MSRTRDEFYWANHTSDRLNKHITGETVAVLPVGAIEQHGPHLPLSVDADINAGLVEAAITNLQSSSLPVLFLPEMPVGKSTEHIDFPGTLSFSAETLMRMWVEIIDCVAAAGVRRLVIFNSHGGQVAPMDIVGRDMRIKHNMLVVSCNWFGLGLPDDLISAHEATYGIHAGELETSMMLHLHPGKCLMEHAQNFPSLIETLNADGSGLGLSAGGKLGWKAGDLNPVGACGDAARATAETGRKAIDHVAGRFVALLGDVSAYDLKRLG